MNLNATPLPNGLDPRLAAAVQTFNMHIRTQDLQLHARPDGTVDVRLRGGKRLQNLLIVDAPELHVRGRLLFAEHLPERIAATYRAADVNYLDAAGNAYIRLPKMIVVITGRKHHATPTLETLALTARPKPTGTTTELKGTFTFLCKPELLNAPQRDIAAAAGIALGAVGPVLTDLAERGLITADGPKTRHIRQRDRMLREWTALYPRKLRPKLKAQRFLATTQDDWGTRDIADLGGQWGGEVAAAAYTNYLKPARATVYVDPNLEANARAAIVRRFRLRPDPDGNFELVDRFWTFPAEPDCPHLVPRTLVYADLLQTNDPRNIETAEMLLDSRNKDAHGRADTDPQKTD